MEAYMEWFWLAMLILFAIAEASTSALISLWFVGGSLVALLVTLFGAPIWLQAVCFVAASTVLLFCLRPLAKKYVNPRKIATNTESYIGKVVLVTEDIDNLQGKGAVKLSGVEWTALSADGKPIEKDTPVRIVRVESTKLCVERAEGK